MKALNKLFSKKILRGIAVFAAAVILFQGLALLFMTPAGLEAIFPYVLAVKSDKIKTGDAGLGEYFSMHKDVEDAGLIILSADLNVGDTYKLAADYLNFLGRFTKISSVAMYTSNSRLRAISSAVVNGDYEAFSKSCSGQRKAKTLSDQFFSFLDKTYSMNSKLSPDNKMKLIGVKSHDDLKGITNALMTELFSVPGRLSGEHVKITDAKTPEQYAELFAKYKDSLTETLGEKFNEFIETYDAVMNGTIEETYIVRNLVKYSPPENGTVFALLPDHLCGEDSPLIEMAKAAYGKVVVTDVLYSDCTTIENKEQVARDDISFPSFTDGISIVDKNKLSGFREYYEKTVNSFDSEALADKMSVIGDTGLKTYFIISGSGTVTYAADAETNTAGTVLVAPGQ